jgi:hypothetical protein
MRIKIHIGVKISGWSGTLTLALIVLGAWIVVLANANSAQAMFGIETFENAFTNESGLPIAEAGAHPYAMTTTLAFNGHKPSPEQEGAGFFHEVPEGDPKDIEVNLPPGVILNPLATETRCTEAEIENVGVGCPNSAAVGVAVLRVGLGGGEGRAPVYNMVPPPGVPGELALNAAGIGVIVHIVGRVRTGGDYGLSADVSGITQKAAVDGTTLTLWGDPSQANHDKERGQCFPPNLNEFEKNIEEGVSCPVERTHEALLTLPTSCTANTTAATMRADSWQEPGQWTPLVPSSPATPAIEGCGRLNFDPRLTVEPEPVTAFTESPSGLNVDLKVPAKGTAEGFAEANLKNALVTLPAGVAVSPSAANGLEACTPEEISLHTAEPDRCPAASKIGSVEVVTPLLEHPLEGSVYLAQQENNPFQSLIALYVTAEGSGALIKLAGEGKLEPSTGQITTTFDNNPQLPFSELKLSFFGGPRAPLIMPSACATYTTTSQLTPWSSEIAKEPSSSFTIGSGCGPQGFSPSFAAGSVNSQAGAFSPFTLTLARRDGEQRLASVQVQEPPGLLGVLKSVVQCPEPQASLGTCGPESQIGHTTVGAGPGPDPVWVGGSVYLTGSYGGAPFGLSIVTHAAAGPFDLGNVVVRARIGVDPHTGQITVSSEPFPTILDGIPLDIRTVNVTVDRSGFLFNPTNCAPLSVNGTVTSTSGASAAVSSPFEAANCGLLPFKPKFVVSTQAKTSKLEGASLHVEVASAPGQANIGKVAVSLPKRLPSRLSTLQKACLAAVFEANPAACSAASQVGTATATTPLLARPLAGPAYLVSYGNEAFPNLVIVLQGEGIVVDLVGNTKIKKGITSSTFNAVPDVPVTKFELTLPRGRYSVLTANGSPCAAPLKMPTTITGQNGAVTKQTTKIAVSGCPKHKRRK